MQVDDRHLVFVGIGHPIGPKELPAEIDVIGRGVHLTQPAQRVTGGGQARVGVHAKMLVDPVNVD